LLSVHGAMTGKAITIDVKGLAGKTSWPVDNLKPPKKGHFIIFVCFGGHIADPNVLPEAWVVPPRSVGAVTYHAPGGRHVVQRSKLLAKGKRFRDAWRLLE
jgi:hypothetical protein